MWINELMQPPTTGAASGFITSAPVRVLQKIGSRLAMVVATVMTFGRNRSRAPSLIASSRWARVRIPPWALRFLSIASSR